MESLASSYSAFTISLLKEIVIKSLALVLSRLDLANLIFYSRFYNYICILANGDKYKRTVKNPKISSC